MSLSGFKGVQPPLQFGERTRDCSPGKAGKEPSVFPSREPGVSGDFWWSQEGCQGPFRPSGRHSSILSWRISRTEKPGRLQSMGSQCRTRLSDSTAIAKKKKCKKAKWLSEEALQIAVKKSEKQRRKAKIYTFECRVPKNSKDIEFERRGGGPSSIHGQTSLLSVSPYTDIVSPHAACNLGNCPWQPWCPLSFLKQESSFSLLVTFQP